MKFIVLAMHRSGTSALMGLLNTVGVYCGESEDLLEPRPCNEKGFFERRDVMELNDRILEAAGGRWDRLSQLSFKNISEKQWAGFRDEAKTILEELSKHEHWGIKDARIALLMDFWRPLLGEDVIVLSIVRNPAQVARSLQKRDEFSTAYGLALWEYYNRQALVGMAGLRVVPLQYEKLLEDPNAFLLSLNERLVALDEPGLELEDSAAKDSFIERDLFHCRADESEFISNASGRARELYEALLSEDAYGWTRVPPVSQTSLDILIAADDARTRQAELEAKQTHLWEQQKLDRENFQSEKKAFQVAHKNLESQLEAAESKVTRAESDLKTAEIRISQIRDELKGSLEDKAREVRTLESELQSAQLKIQEVGQLKNDLDESASKLHQAQSAFNKETQTLKKQKEELRSKTARLEKSLRGALKEINAVSHLLDDLKNSRRWKIGNAVGDVYRRLRSISREEGLPDLIERRLGHARKMCQDVLKVPNIQPKQAAKEVTQEKPRKAASATDNAYTNFEEYWRWATLNRTVKAPFSEPDKRVIGYLDGQYERMRRQCGHMTEGPLVSVIMPTYNRADVIGEAVASVVAQTYTNWELLVVDDAGTDNTEAVLLDIGDRRIKYIKSPDNRGASGARNIGLEQARGEYIAYLDSDNRIHEDFLLLMVNQLVLQPQHRSAYCAQRAFDRKVTRSGKVEEELRFIRFGPFNRSLLENRNFIDINAFMHHRSLFDDLGGFDKSMRRLVDWELLIRYTRDDAPLAIPAVLSDYIYAKQNQQITDVEKFRPAYNAIGERLASDVLEIGVEGRKEGPAHKLKSLIGMESLSLENGVRFEGETLYHRLGQPRLGKVARPVAIVIPSYQAYEYLQICVSAIETFTPAGSYELIIVDNASNENVREFLQELQASGRAKIHLNDENLGFTAAVNQGIEMAAPDADIILMNNDAVVTRGWLEALQEVPELMADVGVVAPRQVLPAMSKTMDAHVPGCARERELDVTLSAHHKNIIDPSLDPVRGLMELSFAPFFCVYITRDCLNKVGLLDAKNGRHYRSDRLYCDAVRVFGGLKVAYTPHSKVYHFLQRSTAELRQRDKQMYQEMFVRNRWITVKQPGKPN